MEQWKFPQEEKQQELRKRKQRIKNCQKKNYKQKVKSKIKKNLLFMQGKSIWMKRLTLITSAEKLEELHHWEATDEENENKGFEWNQNMSENN